MRVPANAREREGGKGGKKKSVSASMKKNCFGVRVGWCKRLTADGTARLLKLNRRFEKSGKIGQF